MKRTILPSNMSQEIKKAIVQLIGVGEENAKNNRELREALGLRGYKVGESELRRLIEELRETPMSEGIILANTTDGYFYEKDAEQAIAYIETLKNRAIQVLQTMNAVKKQFESKYNRSASLFLQPAQVVTELKEMGFSFQGGGIYWHPSARVYLRYCDGRLGQVKSIYDKAFNLEFFSLEEVKEFVSNR